ncbi:HAD-IA family hydrolase [Zafaria sp. Z1313]|uniref:HAD-IA family hydrolase n=1 Tax=unclassified Zafaria TaxID=2828765 RepID=UPI002E760459|nr:HAD-IA family hydrolase [Zafaria sp. J156]MEE1621701.1 HAD-IA family hydrolase [Zafaria sp. J156]
MALHFPSTGFHVDAFLFDLDGTLIDSTAATEAAWSRWGEELGLDGFVYEYHGVPAYRIVDEHVEPERRSEALALIERLESQETDGIVFKEGAEELLAGLPADRWTIVTSCTAGLAAARMGAVGLAAPDHLVTVDQLAHGKPHPEGYLLGAERLGRAIGRCLVFEDAPAGLQAGNGAGAPTLAITGTTASADLSADAVVASLADLAVAVDSDGSLRVSLRD